MNELKWAVLGTGVIANEMAQALHNMVCRTAQCLQPDTTNKYLSLRNIMLKKFIHLTTKCMKIRL